MPGNLAKILGRESSDLSHDINILEAKSGFPSQDVRILAEMRQRLRVKINDLGLDANNTTDEELYKTLQNKYERDSRLLDKAVGVNIATKLTERLSKAAQLVVHCVSSDEAWFVKNSAVKSILSQNPPKHTAKTLHYRSTASMLKREEINEVCLAAMAIESTTWQNSFNKNLAKLKASQRELRPIRIVNLSVKQWQNFEYLQSFTVANQQLGSVALWPNKSLAQAPTLTLVLQLLDGVKSVNPAGFSEVLDELSPALKWWSDCDFLVSYNRQPVSLNIRDNALNHFYGFELSDSLKYNGRQKLWSKISSSYNELIDELSDKVPSYENSAPTSAALAEEFAEAEA